MAKPNKRSNPVMLTKGMSIGSISAETDDDFLFDCFVHHPAVELASRMQAPGMVLSGRTGSGKTAIIRHIERNEPHHVTIDPSEMSLSYVSNSDALRFLQAIGADLDLLFLALWKHVLCIEFIRLKYRVADEDSSRSLFRRLWDRFSADDRKKRSLKYLREWEGKFWITMDQNIKEITEKYESKLQAEMGADIEKFKTRGQYEKQLSTEKKSELIARAKKIVNADQLSELAGVIDLIADHSEDEQTRYFILIDKMDERWVDVSIRFHLTRALIESLKSFRRIRNLKILLALRTDILERVVQETGDLTFQREKFDEYFIRLLWEPGELLQVVQNRIRLLFRRQYSGGDVSFEDVFPYNVGRVNPFEYMLERTLMRPRDIIAFVNEALKLASGQYEVTSTQIREAEGSYSAGRRQALEQEWKTTFPTLPKVLDHLTKVRRASMTLAELGDKDHIDELALKIGTEKQIDFDPLHPLAVATIESAANIPLFVKTIVEMLYRVAAVGIKLDPTQRYIYSHVDQPYFLASSLPDGLKLRVHPMLLRALSLAPQDRY
ncbi:P-loop ATPase, Sll1717 family [Bradyrhizobium oligotrophicum]|uniref:P-loop ATPase, Sll1717 family n=1 Tax=Bradyrhizobium oligotrophicum TaxID=44255 RepID=UPI003EBF260A